VGLREREDKEDKEKEEEEDKEEEEEEEEVASVAARHIPASGTSTGLFGDAAPCSTAVPLPFAPPRPRFLPSPLPLASSSISTSIS
jgi:hypothetical protein